MERPSRGSPVVPQIEFFTPVSELGEIVDFPIPAEHAPLVLI